MSKAQEFPSGLSSYLILALCSGRVNLIHSSESAVFQAPHLFFKHEGICTWSIHFSPVGFLNVTWQFWPPETWGKLLSSDIWSEWYPRRWGVSVCSVGSSVPALRKRSTWMRTRTCMWGRFSLGYCICRKVLCWAWGGEKARKRGTRVGSGSKWSSRWINESTFNNPLHVSRNSYTFWGLTKQK